MANDPLPQTDRAPTMGIHVFANGMKVNQSKLLPAQLARYQTPESGNIHEPEEEEWFKKILTDVGPGGVYLDVGAAIGYYIVLVLRSQPDWRVVALEPNPEMRSAIAETLELNGLDSAMWTVMPHALHDRAGEVLFLAESYGSRVLNGGGGAWGTVRRIARGLRNFFTAANRGTGQLMKVTTITLERLVTEIGGPIDLMKMDIQGGETTVIPGAAKELRQGAVKWLIIGTHGVDAHDACLSVIEGAFDILDNRREVAGQPDGIIIARHKAYA